ncbi:4156_t:CDS:1, partial [Scutellospora calospora]
MECVDIDENESILFSGAQLDNQIPDFVEIPLEQTIREKLQIARNILGEIIIEPIRKIFNKLCETPKTFEDYQQLVIYEDSFIKSLNVLINEEFITLDQLHNNESNQSEIKQEEDRLLILKDLKKFTSQFVNQTVYSRKLNFIQKTLNSPNKEAILFSNIVLTEGGINKRYKELASCFHPDRTRHTNTPNGLRDSDQYLGIELFKIILKFKEDLLTILEKASKKKGVLDFHEKKANEHWKIAIDYRNASKEYWNRLKVFDKEDIKEIPSTDLKRLSVTSGMLAYEEYRAACKVADTAKELNKQIKLRENIALCLYISDRYLEAQLYALSAIRLIYQYSHCISQKDLAEAKKIFDKVRGEKSQLKTDIKLKGDLGNSQALVKAVNQGMSFLEKNETQRSIEEDLIKLSTQLMFKPDRQIVSYQASRENILHSKSHVVKHVVAGVVVRAASLLSICSTTIAFIPLIGCLAPLLGILCGWNLWSLSASLLSEPKIREKLNEIIKNALDAYDKGDYQGFIEILSEEYEKDRSIIKLKDRYDRIDPKSIITSLLKHNFRSD